MADADARWTEYKAMETKQDDRGSGFRSVGGEGMEESKEVDRERREFVGKRLFLDKSKRPGGCSGEVDTRNGAVGETRTCYPIDDKIPQIDAVQRVGHPPDVRAPARKSTLSRNTTVLGHFGPTPPYAKSGKPGSISSRQRGAANRKDCTKNNSATYTRLQDLEKLATAGRRAGCKLQESHAEYCRGVLFDNLEKWDKAIACYKTYLAICHGLGNISGQAIAHNCIGINYYNMAVGGASAEGRSLGLKNDFLGEEGASEETKQYLEYSAKHHIAHFEKSDELGQLVALCNLGICYSRLGFLEEAIQTHQQALEIALRRNNIHAQSVAVGNIALACADSNDLETAQACMDKHLLMARGLANSEGEGLACQQLAHLAGRIGNHMGAVEYYNRAHKLVEETGEKGMMKLIRCNLGIEQGKVRLGQYLEEVSKGF